MMTAAAQLMRSIISGGRSRRMWRSQWIQTADGRDFLVALRLYGTGVEFYDQSWKPDDVVKVK